MLKHVFELKNFISLNILKITVMYCKNYYPVLFNLSVDFTSDTVKFTANHFQHGIFLTMELKSCQWKQS